MATEEKSILSETLEGVLSILGVFSPGSIQLEMDLSESGYDDRYDREGK